jgi:6-phosphofructokinase 1
MVVYRQSWKYLPLLSEARRGVPESTFGNRKRKRECQMKRIAVITSGGDAPGMNAAIRAVVRTACAANVEVMGVRCGFAGLIAGDFTPLSARDVSGIIEQGGTMLGSARSTEFKTREGLQKAITSLETAGIDGVIVIGGNGSQTGALNLSQLGVPVNGVASTIDNDLFGSEITIGVDTAMNIALEAIDRLRTTASSHHRLFITEVMGRDCGYLALTVGLAGGAEVIVIPEYQQSIPDIIDCIGNAQRRGKRHAMVVVAEGVSSYAQTLFQTLKERESADFEPRLTILGHVQRGGRPSAFDRLLATRLAARSTNLLLQGETGNLIGLCQGSATPSPLSQIVGKTKPLPQELLGLTETMRL